MRRLILSVAALVLAGSTLAQVSLGERNNMSEQPLWGPVGFDFVEYYYLPEIETYFDVPQQKFYYDVDGRWTRSATPPRTSIDLDIYQLYKAVVNELQPFQNHAKYRVQYAPFKGRHTQELIRDSKDPRYFFRTSFAGQDIRVKRSGFANEGKRAEAVKIGK